MDLTEEDIKEKIQDIDKQIAFAMQAESYSLSSGMSSQSVKRQSLQALLQLRDYWEKKLQEVFMTSSESGGLNFVGMQGWQR